MPGFHPIDWLLIIGFALLLFGPKTIQTMARGAGKNLGKVKEAKEKLMADLPMEELSKVTKVVSKVPMSPQQAVQMLIASESQKQEQSQAQKAESTPEAPSKPAPKEA